MDSRNSFLTIPLEANAFNVLSCLFIPQSSAHIIRIGRIDSSKINISFDIFPLKSRSQIMPQEKSQIFRAPFTTGKDLVGTRLILDMNTFQWQSFGFIGFDKTCKVIGIRFQISFLHPETCTELCYSLARK